MEKYNFENLLVYKKALVFIHSVYDICRAFPVCEKYSLADQFQRAAISIALNIAEGTGASNAEFTRFINIAKRSTKECVAIISIARMNSYITENTELALRTNCLELSKMLSGLARSLK